MFSWFVIVPAYFAVMLIVGRELPDHIRQRRAGNIVATLIVMAVVSAFAFMALFWRVFLL